MGFVCVQVEKLMVVEIVKELKLRCEDKIGTCLKAGYLIVQIVELILSNRFYAHEILLYTHAAI